MTENEFAAAARAKEILDEAKITQSPPLPPVGDFFFNSPLYTEYSFIPDALRKLTASAERNDNIIDGYCIECQREATFEIQSEYESPMDQWRYLCNTQLSYTRLFAACLRNSNHTINIFARVSSRKIMKVGQFPSLADIAKEEIRTKYRSVLQSFNSKELYKAIGLAAHGEGIASFVYLRRVFERLIASRFAEFSNQHGWKEEEFRVKRMDDKIDFIKEHLPAFLVQTRKIYGVFSLGVHELDDAACLRFYPVGLKSIIAILQEDLTRKEEREAKEALKTAIANFESPRDSHKS